MILEAREGEEGCLFRGLRKFVAFVARLMVPAYLSGARLETSLVRHRVVF
jgi:hypothetical protein